MASPVLFSIAAATTAIAPAIFSAFASPSVVVVVPGTAINPLLGGAVVVGAAITALTRSNLRLKLAQVFRAQSADPEDLNQGITVAVIFFWKLKIASYRSSFYSSWKVQ